MASLSQYLFVSGALLLLFAFVAAIALTTLLATGRRTVAGFATQPVGRGQGPRAAGAPDDRAGPARAVDIPGLPRWRPSVTA